MAKKIVAKRKLKIVNLLVGLLIFSVLSFFVYLMLQIRVKNIIVSNTSNINDDYIISLAGVKDYPKFFLIRSGKIEDRLNKSSYIKSSKVRKKWGFVLEISVDLRRVLFFDNSKNKYILDDGMEIEEDNYSKFFRVSRLLNHVPDDKFKKFTQCMGKIKEENLSKISDIEYQPNDYDKDRFLLYMDDGNMVYLTLTKFNMINHYKEVLSQLEGHKGILYLDNGNHFQIKE